MKEWREVHGQRVEVTICPPSVAKGTPYKRIRKGALHTEPSLPDHSQQVRTPRSGRISPHPISQGQRLDLKRVIEDRGRYMKPEIKHRSIEKVTDEPKPGPVVREKL